MHDYYLNYGSPRGLARQKLKETLSRLGALKVTDGCYYIQSTFEMEDMRRYLRDMLERDESACLIFKLQQCGLAHTRLF